MRTQHHLPSLNSARPSTRNHFLRHWNVLICALLCLQLLDGVSWRSEFSESDSLELRESFSVCQRENNHIPAVLELKNNYLSRNDGSMQDLHDIIGPDDVEQKENDQQGIHQIIGRKHGEIVFGFEPGTKRKNNLSQSFKAREVK